MEDYSRDQLKPVKMPYHNSVMRGPEGTDVGDLDTYISEDESGFVVTQSAWMPDERTRAMLQAGAHVRLSVWQHPIPPLAVAVEAPFCEVCETETELRFGRFECPHGHRQGALKEVEAGERKTAEEQLREDFSPAPDNDAA